MIPMQSSVNLEESGRLIVTFDNQAPVELSDLTLSLLALADEYKRFTTQQVGPAAAADVKLYVNQIREGSIVVDLFNAVAPYSPLAGVAVMPLLTNSNDIIQFTKHLSEAVLFLLGKVKIPGTSLGKANLKNFSEIVEPIAKDPGSTLAFAIGDNNTGNVNFAPIIIVTSTEGNALQNRVRKEIELMGESVSGIKENVLLYWHQTRNVVNSATADKAVIESISPSPVKAVLSPELKAEMVNGTHHPYKTAYLVDVDVQTIGNKPALYRVLRLHEMFPIGDSDQLPMELE